MGFGSTEVVGRLDSFTEVVQIAAPEEFAGGELLRHIDAVVALAQEPIMT